MELGISQQAISVLKQKEALEKIAKALKVTPEAIRNFNEENTIQIIQNNYEGSNQHASNIGPAYYMNFQCTFNPLDKYVEQVEENKKLYDALLKSERDKIALLEKMLEQKK